MATVLVLAMLLEVIPLHALASASRLTLSDKILKAINQEIGQSVAFDETAPSDKASSGTQGGDDKGSSSQGFDIIVRLKEQSGKMMSQKVVDTESLGANIIETNGAFQLIRVEKGMDPESVLKSLRENSSVAYAEPNYRLYAVEDAKAPSTQNAQNAPDDPHYNNQWGLLELETERAWTKAETILAGNMPADVKVAVVDTGVNGDHEDLSARVLSGRNVITGAPDPNDAGDDSTTGHGTHIAGIISAATDNGIGIAGVAGTFPIKIIPIKALDSAGVGTMYDVAQGIRWAADNGARVINLSLGARLPDFPQTLADAVRYAQDRGALVVAAAGNDAKGVEGFYPACLPGVVSAGATDQNHKEAPFSNWAPRNIRAPGVSILSTLPSAVSADGYGTMTGTSQAAGMVSGTAALMWSVFPDKDAAQVQEALREGHKARKSDDGRYYNVLSADYALDELNGNTGADPYLLTFISPDPNADETPRLTGVVDLTVKVGNPSALSRVDFALYRDTEERDETVLGSVYASDFTQGGYGTIEWDTTRLPCGTPLEDGSDYTVMAYSYDAEGNRLSWNGVDVVIANHQETGLILEVKKPDGSSASGAWVTVHHAYLPDPDAKVEYEELWNGPADLNGRVMIPAAVATGGNDYLVTARGTEPSFFYYKIVRAPARVTLDATGAATVSISARREPLEPGTDGQPLAGALALVEMLEANLPASNEPTAVVDFNQYGNETNMMPLVQLGASGTGSITLTHGRYNLRVVSATDKYYLFKYDQAIDESSTAVEFHPQASEVSVLRFEPDETCHSASLVLGGESDPYFYGFEKMLPGDVITVTPGILSADMEVSFRDGSKEWFSSLWKSEIQATAGQTIPLCVGGQVTGTVDRYYVGQEYFAGDWAWFRVSFLDSYNNTVQGLATEPYTQSGSQLGGKDAPDSVPSGGTQSGLNRILMKHAQKEALKEALSGTLETGQGFAGTQAPLGTEVPPGHAVYAFNAESSDFRVVPQSRTWIWPKVEIYGDSGNLVTRKNAGWAAAYWDIPADVSLGAYSIRATLTAGPLGPDDTDGLITTPDLSFEVKPAGGAPQEPPADLTITVQDDAGQPISGVNVYPAVILNGSYYTLPGVWTETDQEGKAELDGLSFLGLRQGDKLALIVYGHHTIGNQGRMLFKIKVITVGEPPMAVAINTGPVKAVSLRAYDQSANQLTGAAFSVYGFDEEGAPVGLILPDYGSGYAGLWLPAGDYLFQARVQSPEYTEDGPSIYYLTKQATVPQEVPEDGLAVSLSAADAAAFTVTGPPPAEGQTKSPYGPVAVSLFQEDVPQAPVFTVGKSYMEPTQEGESQDVVLYVTPGVYHVEGVLVQEHFDGHWDYWLDRNDDVTLEAQGSFEWILGSEFNLEGTTLTTDKGSYEIDESVEMNVNIEDGHGNRLSAMGIGIPVGGGGWYESLSTAAAWRLPGYGQILVPQPVKTEQTSSASDQSPGSPASGEVGVQNHEQIAPFLTVLDPQGQEVSRQKDAGWNYYLLGDTWAGGPGTPVGAMRLVWGSTFFSGRYTIPEGAPGGTYTAIMELETGPDTSLRRETTFDVSAVHAAPVLDALRPFINGRSVAVSGKTLAEAQVSLYSSCNGGQETLVGTATADGEGRFTIEVALDAEGAYSFTATSTVGGNTSSHSLPVSTTVDWTKPTVPSNLSGQALDAANVRLTWNAPEPGIAFYRIKRDGNLVANEVTGGDDLQYQDSGLEPLKEYRYQVTAVDRAGNESDPAEVTVTTLAGLDQIPPTPPLNLRATLSNFRVSLAWELATDNIGVVGYKVYRAIKPDQTGAGLASGAAGQGPEEPASPPMGAAEAPGAREWVIEDPEAVSFQDPDILSARTTYVYTVVAYDAAGN